MKLYICNKLLIGRTTGKCNARYKEHLTDFIYFKFNRYLTKVSIQNSIYNGNYTYRLLQTRNKR